MDNEQAVAAEPESQALGQAASTIPSRFAPWIEAIAFDLHETRAAIARVAAAVPDARWSETSPVPGWTFKDLLAHLAVNHWMCQTLLAGLLADEARQFKPIANSSLVEATDAVLLEEQCGRTVSELLNAVAVEGHETEAMLARLRDKDEARSGHGGLTITNYLREVIDHDRMHLSQLNVATARLAVAHD